MDDAAAALSHRIWQDKYRFAPEGRPEAMIADSWRRIASALAAAEPVDRSLWAGRFYGALENFRFLPGGRIQAGAGTGRDTTLFNCFVMGTLEDSVDGIFRALHESALTMQMGGGIGIDFSPLRPAGMRARRTGNTATGPVSFMQMWDAMCATVMARGARRGAMMATLRCDHPDIECFIDAKSEPGALRHFNLSVLISDDFMAAVRADAGWPLVFPAAGHDLGGDRVTRSWPGHEGPVECRIVRVLGARELWSRITASAWNCAEPGVLFIDRINALNNLGYREQIAATNPCGEVPLPPYGACNLGSVNLTQFVRAPFTPQADFDRPALAQIIPLAVRMLDNVIDISNFPLPAQARVERDARRIGLGITGLGDALLMLGARYGDARSLELAGALMRDLCHGAYRASIALAREKGAFPAFECESYLDSGFVRTLPAGLRDDISARGIRNSHLTAIAPAGSISLLAGNVSSGLEPIFAARTLRTLTGADGSAQTVELTDPALRLWQSQQAGTTGTPSHFVTASELPPAVHLDMQAALQPYVDSSISKTVNVAADYPLAGFREIYSAAFDKGLKGCTVFRPNPVTGSVLTAGAAAGHSCRLEPGGDCDTA